jgi:glutathione S-transferase
VLVLRTARAVERSVNAWNRCMGILDAQLARTGAYVAGQVLTLADIVGGLGTHRWYMTPMQRPDLPHVAAYYEKLSERPGYRLHGRTGEP